MDSILEEKIVRANALLQERNQIDAELAEIFGVSVAIVQAKVKPQKEKTERKKSKCGVCGKSGHNVKTCKENKPEAFRFSEERNENLALTNANFQTVKLMADKGRSAADIAHQINATMEEVGIAMKSPHYVGYIHDRKKA